MLYKQIIFLPVSVSFSFFFLFFFWKSGREPEKNTDLCSAGLFPKCPKQSGQGEMNTWSLELNPGSTPGWQNPVLEPTTLAESWIRSEGARTWTQALWPGICRNCCASCPLHKASTLCVFLGHLQEIWFMGMGPDTLGVLQEFGVASGIALHGFSAGSFDQC